MKIKNKSLFEKVINIFLNICIFIFVLILLITIYSNIQTKIFKKGYSDFFGYSMFEVQTGSMSDAINAGDWIIVKSNNNFKLDDIVTYKQNNNYITHRIISIYNNTFITKGDANNTKDDPINKDQVIGKVVKVLPNFGIFKKVIFNPTVLMAIIITIFLFNLLFKNNKKEKSNKNNKFKILNKKIKIKTATLEKSDKKIEEPMVINSEQAKPEEIKKIEEVPSFIPVDAEELDDTFLEIAKNEIEEPDKKVIKEKPEEIYIEEPPIPKKINLELLENSKNKKSKNIIEKIMLIKIEEINEIINTLDDDGKIFVNEPTIKNTLMGTYIDARYYNYFGDNPSSNKKLSLKIENLLCDKSKQMISLYKGSDIKYGEKVNKYASMFVLISNIEQANSLITDFKAKTEYYKKELIKFSKDIKWNNQTIKNKMSDIMKIQRNYIGILEYFYKKMETNMFNITFDNLSTKKNISIANLNHNIYFSKVYSDYIIDKTYNEGIIAEDKIVVLLTLLSIRLVQDMINSNYNKKYIIYLPETLYSKEKKLEKILKMIEDEYAKDNVLILIRYNMLLKYKSLVKRIRKEGYKFAVVFDKEETLNEKSYSSLYIADYIFVDKKVINVVKMLSELPEDLEDNIIYENIIDKLGDFGGE